MADNDIQYDLAQRRLAVDRFLADVEHRALHMAMIATRQRDDALDIVQDAMLTWANHYVAYPTGDWKPLFYKVLNSRIRDWQRRSFVKWRIFGRFGHREDDSYAGVDGPDCFADPLGGDPVNDLTQRQSLERLLRGLEQLPLRQQQAFILRSWEGLDVAATAVAMGCSQGSVKTHLSRALNSLRAYVGDTDE